MDQFEITWTDLGREPQIAPNPAYPQGIDLDASKGALVTCKATLPYPAKRCGFYIIRCTVCRYAAAATTAGRPDDPRSVVLPCNFAENQMLHH